jgi:hypothetical protein
MQRVMQPADTEHDKHRQENENVQVHGKNSVIDVIELFATEIDQFEQQCHQW